eukprot:1158046-Pelagomonas_calceolata.AAC.7
MVLIIDLQRGCNRMGMRKSPGVTPPEDRLNEPSCAARPGNRHQCSAATGNGACHWSSKRMPQEVVLATGHLKGCYRMWYLPLVI